MILLADSGSTKTDWCVAEGGKPLKQLTTRGINPYFQTEEEIEQEITGELLPRLDGLRPDSVHFYGAGCINDKAEAVHRALTHSLGTDAVEVCTDMLAAARALCGHEAGIACILGTGSNSCFYNGREIEANVSPLGFILGDEGSGACLGKLLVGDLLKGQMPTALKDEFLSKYDLTPTEIIDRVYRRPFPNRFLASLSPFLAGHLQEPCVRRLVTNSFRAFLCRNVKHYDYRRYEVHFTGSIAFHYQPLLAETAEAEGIRLGQVVKSPLEGLIGFHA